MTTNKQDSLTRAKAIYTAFKPYLSQDQLMQVLLHWENKYANGDSFPIRYFVTDITKKFQPKVPTKTLHVSLVSELNKPSVTKDDPISMLKAYKVLQHQENKTHYAIPEIDAFIALLKKWMGQIDATTIINMHAYLAKEIASLDIDAELEKEVTRWFTNPKHKIVVAEVDIKDLQEITTLVYVASCAYLGPSRTDELLSSTLKALVNNGGAIYADIFKKLL